MDALAITKIHIAARESLHVVYIFLGELLSYLIPGDICGTHIDLLIPLHSRTKTNTRWPN